MDDLRARRVASALQIRYTGTLGVLIAAKQNGLLAEIRARLNMLRDSDIHLGEKVARKALRLAGEDW